MPALSPSEKGNGSTKPREQRKRRFQFLCIHSFAHLCVLCSANPKVLCRLRRFFKGLILHCGRLSTLNSQPAATVGAGGPIWLRLCRAAPPRVKSVGLRRCALCLCVPFFPNTRKHCRNSLPSSPSSPSPLHPCHLSIPWLNHSRNSESRSLPFVERPRRSFPETRQILPRSRTTHRPEMKLSFCANHFVILLTGILSASPEAGYAPPTDRPPKNRANDRLPRRSPKGEGGPKFPPHPWSCPLPPCETHARRFPDQSRAGMPGLLSRRHRQNSRNPADGAK